MIKKVLLIFLIVIVVFIGALYAVTPYLMGEKDSAEDYFKPLTLKYEETFQDINGITLHSVQTGDTSSSKFILFIHGTPGSWIDFKTYLSDSTLLRDYQMISIDRPGFGLSNYGQSMISIEEQAALLLAYLNKVEYDSLVLVGYSYGGPIAGILASNATLPVSKLILLSPANDPECEPIFWFNELLNYNFVTSLLPDFIKVANHEKMQHANELDQITDMWQSVNVPTVHIHSVDDWIAPYLCNVTYSKEMIDESNLEIITIEGDAHFLPNDKLEIVRNYIVD